MSAVCGWEKNGKPCDCVPCTHGVCSNHGLIACAACHEDNPCTHGHMVCCQGCRVCVLCGGWFDTKGTNEKACDTCCPPDDD